MAGTGRVVPRRLDKPPPDAATLDTREQQLLDDFHALLSTAHFRVLTAKEWETAQAENFTVSEEREGGRVDGGEEKREPNQPTAPATPHHLTSPVTVDWDALDTKLIASFWSRYVEDHALAAPMCDRILIYHRGIRTLKASGRFIDDKVDLLVDYLVVGPLTRLAALVRSRGRRAADPDAALALQQAVLGGAAAPGAAAVSASDAAAAARAEREALAHDAAQTVRRVSLRAALPSVWSVLKSLPVVSTIEEPAYKDVVVLYRRIVPYKQVGCGVGGGGLAFFFLLLLLLLLLFVRLLLTLSSFPHPTHRSANPRKTQSGTTTRPSPAATST